jgi:hypothetical protein
MLIKKSKCCIVCIILLSILILYLYYKYQFQSYIKIDKNYKNSIHNCIYNSKNHKHVQIYSLDNIFDIAYVENTNKYSINPYFPAININSKIEHNAWLHCINTDTVQLEFRNFIDTVDPVLFPEIYPFYTLQEDFYDAPLWKNHSLFNKPLSFWIGHAWAVLVDFEKKTIKPIGGILWGFRLSYFAINPIFIQPSALNLKDWENDWKVFSKKLLEFSVIYK